MIYNVDKETRINAIGGETAYTTAYINGIICEIVFFPTALSVNDRTTLVNSLITKWGVVV